MSFDRQVYKLHKRKKSREEKRVHSCSVDYNELLIWRNEEGSGGFHKPSTAPLGPNCSCARGGVAHALTDKAQLDKTYTQVQTKKHAHTHKRLWSSVNMSCDNGTALNLVVRVRAVEAPCLWRTPQQHTICILLQSHGCSFVPAVMSLPLHQSEWDRLQRTNKCLEPKELEQGFVLFFFSN